MCKSCAARQITAECAHCGVVKQVVARDAAGQRICEPCHGRDRGGRRCGVCGQTALITVRARGGTPDICVSCYRMPSAVCGKYRECNFARTGHPLCRPCTPRACASCAGLPATSTCADCGAEDKLYDRGRCERCSLRRRATALLAGPGGTSRPRWPRSWKRSARPAPPNPRSTGYAAKLGRPSGCSWVAWPSSVEDPVTGRPGAPSFPGIVAEAGRVAGR